MKINALPAHAMQQNMPTPPAKAAREVLADPGYVGDKSFAELVVNFAHERKPNTSTGADPC